MSDAMQEPHPTLVSLTYAHGPTKTLGVLKLAGARTVLVGRNGAGKSLILETVADAANHALHGVTNSWADQGGCIFGLHYGADAVDYSIQVDPPPLGHDPQDDLPHRVVREACFRNGQELWKVDAGEALVNGQEQRVLLPPTSGLVSARIPLPETVAWLRQYLRGVRLVRAGVPRRARRDLVFVSQEPGDRWKPASWVSADLGERVGEIAARVANWFDGDKERFGHLVEVARRLGLGTRIELSRWPNNMSDAKTGGEAQNGVIYLDDVNLGLLPDGSLRCLEVLVDMLDPGVTTLLIEEPETSIHPGLLRRLLAELETVAPRTQVVMSTHSPLVASWVKPTDLRWVQWQTEGPTARPLSQDELHDVASYLSEEGSLGEFVFDGGLDA